MKLEPSRLNRIAVLSFASVGVPIAALNLPIAVFVAPMYAEELGLGTALVGLIFMLLRFWDIITDPLMGWLVDAKPTRRGRIKHWLAASVPILGISAIFVFAPMGQTVGTWYLVFWLAVMWVGYTMLLTPHQCWVPLITNTYDERTRLFMWREVVMTGSMVFLLILPTWLALEYELGRRAQVMVMGAIVAASLPITVGLALKFVRDAPPKPGESAENKFSWPVIRAAFRDRAVLQIVVVDILAGIGFASTGATFLFAAKWGFGVEATAPLALMVYFISGFIAIPFWVWVSKRFEKHIALQAVSAWTAVAYILFFFFSEMGGGFALLTLAAVLSGVGYGPASILLRSMMADVIEREEAETGENRAGLYYAIMTGAFKVGASFAIGVPYILLGMIVGFDPAGDNSPEVVDGLMYVFVGVPIVSFALAALIARRYPLTRRVQKEAAALIAAKNRALAGE